MSCPSLLDSNPTETGSNLSCCGKRTFCPYFASSNPQPTALPGPHPTGGLISTSNHTVRPGCRQLAASFFSDGSLLVLPEHHTLLPLSCGRPQVLSASRSLQRESALSIPLSWGPTFASQFQAAHASSQHFSCAEIGLINRLLACLPLFRFKSS